MKWPHRELRLGFGTRARLLETVPLIFEGGEDGGCLTSRVCLPGLADRRQRTSCLQTDRRVSRRHPQLPPGGRSPEHCRWRQPHSRSGRDARRDRRYTSGTRDWCLGRLKGTWARLRGQSVISADPVAQSLVTPRLRAWLAWLASTPRQACSLLLPARPTHQQAGRRVRWARTEGDTWTPRPTRFRTS